nr:hypothetical protein [Bacillus cereus]
MVIIIRKCEYTINTYSGGNPHEPRPDFKRCPAKTSQDPTFRMSYEARQKVLMNEASRFAYAEKIELEKGIELNKVKPN